MHELGWDPEDLSRSDVIAFCEGHLNGFLAARGLRIGRSAARRLLRAVRRFNPMVLTPEERFASF